MNRQSNPLRGAETLAPNKSPLKDLLAAEGATVGFGAATLTRQGDRVVFTGSPTGSHSLDYDESDGDRLIAHAKGYAAAAAERTPK
jgi:hypothetical protein